MAEDAPPAPEQIGRPRPSPAWALITLIRWPGAVTAGVNAMTGFLLAHRPDSPGREAAAAGAILGGVLVYAGATVLNDAADAERDRTLHPERPIPSGFVSRGAAYAFGLVLLVLGVTLAGLLAGPAAGIAILGAAAAAALYDFGGKRYRVPGSLLMGAARGLNGLAGAIAAAGTLGALTAPAPDASHAAAMALLFPVALATYTALLTFVSTFEESRPERRTIGLLAGALVFVAVLPWPLFLVTGWRLAPAPAFLLLAGSILIGAREAMDPDGPGLGAVVRSAVFGFMLVDAAWLAGVGKYDWSAGVLIAYLALRAVLSRARS